MTDAELSGHLAQGLAFETVAASFRPDLVGIGGRESIGDGLTLVTVPAIMAAAALQSSAEGVPDLFSMRVGPPCAALRFGVDPKDLIRHLLARATAPSEGRDSGPYATDLEKGLLGPVSVPGKSMAVMAGAALAMRLSGDDRVALLVDDVAGSATGDWHEGLNFAAVSRAPFVLVCTATEGGSAPHTALERLDQKGPAYGLNHWTVSDADPFALHGVILEAVSSARGGSGAAIVEVTHEAGEAPADFMSRIQPSPEVMMGEFETAKSVFTEMFEEVRSEAVPDSKCAYGAPGSQAQIPWYRTPDLRTDF